MKFFTSTTVGIFVLFTCFLLVSAGHDIPFENLASNSTTEFPCNRENGCNTTETGTASPLNASDITVFPPDNTTCLQNDCQTTSDSRDSNATLTTESADAISSSESVKWDNESTTVAYFNTTGEKVETELVDITSNFSESQTTVTEASTDILNKNDSLIEVTTIQDPDNSSITTPSTMEMNNSSTTTPSTMEMDNSTTSVMSVQYNSSEINITTDTSSEISNYTEIPETTTVAEIFTEINSTIDTSPTDAPLAVDANITAYDVSTTESPLITENITANQTTEWITAETTDDLGNITNEPSDTPNVTEISDHPATEPVTNYTIVDLPTVTPHRNFLTIEIQINCSNNQEQKEISASLAEFLNTTLKDPNECAVLRNVSLVVPNEKVDFLKVSEFLVEKYNAIRLVRIWSNSRDFNLTTDTVAADEVTESEVVLYVTLGASLGIVLLLSVVITCFKCLRKKSSKPLDLDVPHLNLRLEDYTLTRIPRPNTVYLDYYRGPIINDRYSSAPLSNSVDSANSERGLIQPFDTSVVPLEDAKKLEELGPPIMRNDTNCPATPLRTFGRKDWKNRDGLIYENIMSSSTEKLHSDFFKSGNRGQDNPSFAA